MKQLPSNTVELIKELDKMFPDRMVIDQMDESERLKLAGKVELIRYLKYLPGSGVSDVNANK